MPRSADSTWYVYILLCKDASLYTGITTDISRRLKQHNGKSGGRYTRIRTPVTLLHQEPHRSRSAALKREAQIKHWPRARKFALIGKNKKGKELCAAK